MDHTTIKLGQRTAFPASDLLDELAREVRRNLTENEHPVLSAAVQFDLGRGLARPMVLACDNIPPGDELSWAIFSETLAYWAIEELGIANPSGVASAATAREHIKTAVTREWLITDEPIEPDLMYGFFLTVIENGDSLDPRLASAACGGDEGEVRWHFGDAAHVLIEQSRKLLRPGFPDVLSTAVDASFSTTGKGA